MPAPRPTVPPDPAEFSARRDPDRDADGAIVIALVGDLDVAATPALTDAVTAALVEDDVVLDLARVEFVALAGLDALAALAATARLRDRGLRAVRCSRAVSRTADLAARLGIVVGLDGLEPASGA